jgi:hypothetical protein
VTRDGGADGSGAGDPGGDEASGDGERSRPGGGGQEDARPAEHGLRPQPGTARASPAERGDAQGAQGAQGAGSITQEYES